jgi:hypothetical protein
VEKSNQFSGHASFANLNEPNVNAIIVHDGELLEDGMKTMTSSSKYISAPFQKLG